MSQGPAWPLLALAAGLLLGGTWLFAQRWSRARHLQDTPTSRIRSAAQGYVELYGVIQATPEGVLEAPLSGVPCLWWRYRIEECREGGKGQRWRLLEQGCSEAWLCLVDATGTCLIDPRGAEVLPASRQVWRGDRRHPRQEPTRGWRAWLAGGRRYRYVEERLHAGEPLYAIGAFRSCGGGRQDGDLQALQGQIIREWKGDYAGLLQRFDSDGNGRLDPPEWRRVRLAARLEAEDRRALAQAAPLEHRLVRPDSGRPFVLSSRGEEELARRYLRQAGGAALLCLAGAALLAKALGG